ERVIRWDDPDIGIDWPLLDGRDPLLSEKDAAGLKLTEADCFP
ncbi:MAG: dTDP-4-dehydrorhamnose 3,5-epimerase family protein, partial [Thermoanaerobaculia bacterium]